MIMLTYKRITDYAETGNETEELQEKVKASC